MTNSTMQYEIALHGRIGELLQANTKLADAVDTLTVSNKNFKDAVAQSVEHVQRLQSDLVSAQQALAERNTQVSNAADEINRVQKALAAAHHDLAIMRANYEKVPIVTLDDATIERAINEWHKARSCYGPGGGLGDFQSMLAALKSVLPNYDRIRLNNSDAVETALRELTAWATDVMGPEGTPIPDGHPILKARAAIMGAKNRTDEKFSTLLGALAAITHTTHTHNFPKPGETVKISAIEITGMIAEGNRVINGVSKIIDDTLSSLEG